MTKKKTRIAGIVWNNSAQRHREQVLLTLHREVGHITEQYGRAKSHGLEDLADKLNELAIVFRAAIEILAAKPPSKVKP